MDIKSLEQFYEKVILPQYASAVFDDELSYEIVTVNGERSIRFDGDPPFKYVENITGYFTLYKEKNRVSVQA